MTKAERDLPQQGVTRMERLALRYSDNTFGVLREGATLEKAEDERRLVDENERRTEHLTRIVRVSIKVFETLFDPTIPASAAKTNEHRLQCGRPADRVE